MVARVPKGNKTGGQFTNSVDGKTENVPKGPIKITNKTQAKPSEPTLLPSLQEYKFGHPVKTLSYIPIPVFGGKTLGFIPKRHNVPVGFKHSLESDEIISLTEYRNRGVTWQCKCGRAHLYIGSDFGFSDATTRTGWILHPRGVDYDYRLSSEERNLVDKLYKKNPNNENIESSKWLSFQDKHICETVLRVVVSRSLKSSGKLYCTCGKEYRIDVYGDFISKYEFDERVRKAEELAQLKKEAKEARKAKRLEEYKQLNGGSAKGFEKAEIERKKEKRARRASEDEEDDRRGRRQP